MAQCGPRGQAGSWSTTVPQQHVFAHTISIWNWISIGISIADRDTHVDTVGCCAGSQVRAQHVAELQRPPPRTQQTAKRLESGIRRRLCVSWVFSTTGGAPWLLGRYHEPRAGSQLRRHAEGNSSGWQQQHRDCLAHRQAGLLGRESGASAARR